MPEDYFGERVAARYDESAADISRPAVVDPVVDLLAELAGDGAALELGIGTGRIAVPLRRRGVRVHGIDLSPAMIDLARRARPDLRFDLGSLLELDIPDGTLGGVLVHYSIIHTPPDQLPLAFAEFSRVLAPGGYLLVSFQTGDDALHGWQELDHKVVAAYRWSLAAMATFLAPAGLTEVARLRGEPSPSNRFHEGHLLARKSG